VSGNNSLTKTSKTLSKNGRMSTAVANFSPREGQINMALAIEQQLGQQSPLIIEAGTGIGKTFAYLIPSLLHDKKTIISTGTKTLQDQLFEKDLPALIKALGLSRSTQILKGRSNYLCRYRIELNAEQGTFYSEQTAQDFNYIKDNLARANKGDINEFSDIAEDSHVWPQVTSTVDNCLSQDCAYYEECFLIKARKKALKSDVVIINHHLYFADSMLKEDGFAELLPGADVIVFDEAHQLAEIASNFYGSRISSRQINTLLNDIELEVKASAQDMQQLDGLKLSIQRQLDTFRRDLEKNESKIGWHQLKNKEAVNETFALMKIEIKELCDCLEIAAERSKGLSRCHERCLDLLASFNEFEAFDDKGLRWSELFKSNFVLHSTPLSVAKQFQQSLLSYMATPVFTSATLSVDSNFDYFTKPLGLEDARSMMVDSPFDYQKQSIFYMPRGLPDVKDKNYYTILVERALPVINAFKGKTFFLFTSYRAMNQVAELLASATELPLLIQGDEPKQVLLNRFKQNSEAILLGTSSFWEGVDVKGKDLSCVIIDKLPFESPNDPITKAKIDHTRRNGYSPFDDYQLPHAIIALKQGIGRLIRDVSDKGVLMIGDPRLYARAYGKRFFASLPRMNKTRNEQEVLTFIHELNDEAYSD
jgi:ATP-dependent DNA helicase DinG